MHVCFISIFASSTTKTAVRQLDKLASVAEVVLVHENRVLVMQFATSKVLVFITSQLLLVAFIFGNTCKTIFEAIILVFVTMPFDVGDRCIIEGVQVRYTISSFYVKILLLPSICIGDCLILVGSNYADGSWRSKYFDDSVLEIREWEDVLSKCNVGNEAHKQLADKPGHVGYSGVVRWSSHAHGYSWKLSKSTWKGN